MLKCLLMLALLAPATLAVAQDASTLSQSLALHTRFLDNQNGGIEGSYNFSATMPVIGYGLGAMSLMGGVDYERVPTGSGTASALGLNTVGFGTSLFPTLPIHLSLDYTHSRIPDVGGLGGAEGQTYGAGLSFNSRWLGDTFLSYRAGDMDLGAVSEQWHLWKFTDQERLGGTQASVNLVHQDYQSPGNGLNFTSTFLNASAATTFGRNWSFHNQLSSSQSTGLGTEMDLSSDLVGLIGGKGTSFTSLSEDGALLPGGNQWATSLSQSLSWRFGQFNAFGSLSRVGTTGLLPNDSPESGSASLGGAYMLPGGWSLAGDASQTWGLGGYDSTSVHLGVAQGGAMPDLIKHALFYFSDRQFQHQIAEDYPPGYIPAELSTELMQRRMARQGTLRYSADVWHAQMSGSDASQDWARMSGELEFFSSLHLLINGDWKRDDGFTSSGVMVINRGLNVNASYLFSWASASLTGGLGNTSSGPGALGNATFIPQESPIAQGQGHTASYLSAALQSQVRGIPLGGSLSEMRDVMGLRTTFLNTYTMVTYGKVQLRLGMQETWVTGGAKSRQVTVDLVRWFDTISFWAPWSRF